MVGKNQTNKSFETFKKDEERENRNSLILMLGVLNGKVDEIISLLKELVKKNNKPVKTTRDFQKEESEKVSK